jgi:uncharacterized protein DUF4382/carboxypeptidase family protein
MRWYRYLALLSLVTVAAGFLASCGSSSQTATVSTSISDPAPCGAPQGPFSHVYVTVTDVQINQSSSAGDNDPGWVDLTPNLSQNPVQVDLLGVANQCFLATLGSTGIKPGNYQQIRVILAKDSISVTGNKCGVASNCVMLTSDLLNTPIPLQLSSESNTGIKIPSGQIAGGQFAVAGGDNKDLNIDFNACASVVVQGSGQYRLKPVLHGGEVALQSTSTSISGTVVDSATNAPIVGGNTVVALEQNQNGIDRVIMQTVTGSNGTFSFCPVAAGTYDVVVSAINGNGTVYGATVITGVQPGNSLANLPVTAAGAPATITGQITTSKGGAATSADLDLSALQSITANSANLMVTVPLAQQSAATATLATASGTSCPANTGCAGYSLAVPAGNPRVGTFVSSGNQNPAAPASGTVNYTLDANAFVPESAGQPDCSPSELQTNKTSTNAALSVNR